MSCGKISYVSKNQAMVSAKKSGFKNCRPYRCPICSSWHITSADFKPTERLKKRFTLPHSAAPKAWVPSIAKLRRKLKNSAQLIVKQTRQLAEIEQKFRAQQAERDEELRCIEIMFNKQHQEN